MYSWNICACMCIYGEKVRKLLYLLNNKIKFIYLDWLNSLITYTQKHLKLCTKFKKIRFNVTQKKKKGKTFCEVFDIFHQHVCYDIRIHRTYRQTQQI